MNKTSRRILAIGLPLCLIAATGAAVAFWTGSGTGAVSGTAESAATPVVLALKTPITGLVPGATVTVPVTATNPNAKTSVSISTLTAGVLTAAEAIAGQDCDTVAGATVTATPPAAGVVLTPLQTVDYGTLSIFMDNTGVNQDACKGAVFSVTLTAS